jgi:hypothetical protein
MFGFEPENGHVAQRAPAHARKRRSALLQKGMSRAADNLAVLHLSRGCAAVVVDAAPSRQRLKGRYGAEPPETEGASGGPLRRRCQADSALVRVHRLGSLRSLPQESRDL